MLAYRHLFHAGNFADVFKHSLLVQLAFALGRKDKPFFYLDTHAGIGRYDLNHPWAQKNGEYREGIARIFASTDYPETVRPYLDAVRACNSGGDLRFYPGSPLLISRLLRENDRMALVELNKDDCVRLQKEFGRVRSTQVRNMDGYQALKAFLPPKERRALVLIDSSFDRASEYRRIADALTLARERFATGVYAVWYPLMAPADVSTFERRIVNSGVRKLLKLELSVRAESLKGRLGGSAMLVVNPPFGFADVVSPMLHWLWKVLSPHGEGRYSVKWLASE